jgi:hypothetical protein
MQQVSSADWFNPDLIGNNAQEVKILTKWKAPLVQLIEKHFQYLQKAPLTEKLAGLRAKLLAIGSPIICKPPMNLPPSLQSYSALYFGKKTEMNSQIPTELLEKPSIRLHLLQPVLNSIFEQLQSNPPQNTLAVEALIRQILGLSMLEQPGKDATITIPMCVEGKWEHVPYGIELIPLAGGLYAYGLKSMDNQKALPFLIFKGTGTPSDAGFMRELETDLTPGKMVGKTLFDEGRGNIEKWFKDVPDRSVSVCGISLGGSLGLLTSMNFHKKIDRIFCYNCPAMTPDEVKNWNEDPNPGKPQIFIFLQHGDFISRLGTQWPLGSRVFVVFGDNLNPSYNESHNALFLAFPDTVLVEVDPTKDRDWQSTAITVGHTVASCLAWPILKGVSYFKKTFLE